jgi:hypothetical protein
MAHPHDNEKYGLSDAEKCDRIKSGKPLPGK